MASWTGTAAACVVAAGLGVAGSGAGLYVYLPDVLVVSTADEADGFLASAEVSLGVQPSSDPLVAANPALNRVDRIERIMTKHWERLDATCDPNAVFALMYLVTTRGIRDHIQEAHFADNQYLATITVSFAKLYLDAYDAWRAGDRVGIQLGWLEAFDYATTGQSSITEDEFLGMNAHINYDLAVAIAALGTTAPDGTSRKPDMDRVNHVLHDVTDDVGYWIAYHYGPTPPTAPPSSAHTTGTDLSDSTLILEPVYGWREGAWQNALVIGSAPDAGTRAAHDATMQYHAWTVAQALHSPKLTSPAPERVAYCSTHP